MYIYRKKKYSEIRNLINVNLIKIWIIKLRIKYINMCLNLLIYFLCKNTLLYFYKDSDKSADQSHDY